jgi:hypothetical protein
MLVRMKMGARSNNIILTSGWNIVVRKFDLREDDKVLFCFFERDDGDLDLLVDRGPSTSFRVYIVTINARLLV